MRIPEALVGDLVHGESVARQRAMDSLARKGASAVPMLRRALHEVGPDARYWVLAALVRIGGPAVPALCKTLDADTPGLSADAAHAIIRVGPPAVHPLCDMLHSLRWQTRVRAAELLGRIGEPRAIKPLCFLMHDEHSEVRRQALRSLLMIGSPAVSPMFTELVQAGWPEAAGPREALVQVGAPAVPALCSLLENPCWLLRRDAVVALGRIGDAGAIPHLVAALKDPAKCVRRRAVEALGKMGNDAAVVPLVEVLSDRVPQVRAEAVKALGRLGDASVVPVLNERLADPDWEVRVYAARALGRLADTCAVGPLIAALKGGRVPAFDAASALSAIAERDPVPELRAALPLLRRGLSVWSTADVPTQQRHRSHIEQIDAATAPFRDLPLPARAPAPRVEVLPLPAAPAAPAPSILPIPALATGTPGAAETATTVLRLIGDWKRGWQTLRTREPAPPRR